MKENNAMKDPLTDYLDNLPEGVRLTPAPLATQLAHYEGYSLELYNRQRNYHGTLSELQEVYSRYLSDRIKEWKEFEKNGDLENAPKIITEKEYESEYKNTKFYKELKKERQAVLAKAEKLVIEYFGDKQRKLGTGKVIDHLYGVRDKVKEYTDNEIIWAAALLHDIVEDTSMTIEQLREEVGEEVVNIIKYVTEEKDLKWIKRKEKYIRDMQAAYSASIMISMADKIDNLQSIISDYKEQGEEIWKHFNSGRGGVLKYFFTGKEASIWFFSAVYEFIKELEEVYGTGAPKGLLKEYKIQLDELYSLVNYKEGRAFKVFKKIGVKKMSEAQVQAYLDATI